MADAAASRARGSSESASSSTVAMRSGSGGAGAICQLVVDRSGAVNHEVDGGPHLTRTRTRSSLAAWQQRGTSSSSVATASTGTAARYDVVNPATEAVVGQAPEASVAQVEAAAAAAADAFPAWSRTKPEERAALLNKAADLLRDRMEELIPLVQAETGATQRVASTMQVPDVHRAVPPLRQGRPRADGRSRCRRARCRPPRWRPAGSWGRWSCASPSAWSPASRPYNFPIVNMAGKIGPALAMGNTVVVKPAPQDPLAVTVFGEVLHDAGLPRRGGQRRHRLERRRSARRSSRRSTSTW